MGEFKVVCDGVVVGPRAPKARALLACLASAPNQHVGIERIAEAIWDESPPETARNAVQVYVAQWRRVLKEHSVPASIRSSHGGYSLRVDPSCIDVSRLELLSDLGRSLLQSGDPESALRAFGGAVEICGGRFLQDLEDSPVRLWLEAHVMQLERGVRLGEAQTKIQLGEAEGCVAALRRLAKEEPDSEQVVGALMHALYLSGKQRDALVLFEAFRKTQRSYGLEPTASLRELEHRILVHDWSLVPAPMRMLRSGLPRPPRPFVGDRSVIDLVAGLVGDASKRLVTLVGFAGTGKTTIAVEAAQAIRSNRRRPVIFVPLEDIGNKSSLLRALAKCLGVIETDEGGEGEAVLVALRDLSPLLVLDKAEHLIPAVRDVIGGLVSTLDTVTLLVTSRAALDFPGECVVHIECPRTAKLPDEDPACVPAVVLLSEFMRPATVVGEDLEFALELCSRLDGNPMALEIAAARARRLGLSEVVLGLRRNPGFLARHHAKDVGAVEGIDAAIQWSFSLLSPMSQRALLAVAQFPGGFEVGHVQAVLPEIDGDQALEIVDELLVHNLAARVPQRLRLRCHLPQLVVDFCFSRIPEEVRNEYWRRYSRWITAILGKLDASSPRTARRYHDLLDESSNVRRLVSLIDRHSSPPALALISHAIYEWWMYDGDRLELLEWIELALAQPNPAKDDRRSLHLLAGRVAAQLGDYSASERHLLAALNGMSRPDSIGVSARITLGENFALAGDFESAQGALFGLDASPSLLNDDGLRVRLLLGKAIVEQLAGNLENSLVLLEAARELSAAVNWLDARVKSEVVSADILRHSGLLLESEAKLMALTAEIERTQSSELRELVLGMLSSLCALGEDRLGAVYFGAESLSAMTGESRDIETVLRVVLALGKVGVGALDDLARRAAQLRELFLACFPTPQVLVNELRALRLPPLQQAPRRGIPQGWVALTDELLYELRRAVATGSAR